LVFQSVAGTEAANKSFGIDLKMLGEAHEAAKSSGFGVQGSGNAGEFNVMYFETGQGGGLSANGDHGVDQQRLEARADAVAGARGRLLEIDTTHRLLQAARK